MHPHQRDPAVNDLILGLETAAAGTHHTLITGAHGTGKSLAARALHTLRNQCEQDVPFRCPHHSASFTAMLGNRTTPGEITRAAAGILLLDEVDQFPRLVLEAIANAIDSGNVIHARPGEHDVTRATRCQIVATLAPCPCGHCCSTDIPGACPPTAIARHLARVANTLGHIFQLNLQATPAITLHSPQISDRSIARVSGAHRFAHERNARPPTTARHPPDPTHQPVHRTLADLFHTPLPHHSHHAQARRWQRMPWLENS